ncbi:MAG: hypothetical protein ACT4P7_21435 [Gemmatimonadaceae bacterium]
MVTLDPQPTPAPSLYRATWARRLVFGVAVTVVIGAIFTAIVAGSAYAAGDRDRIIVLAAAWAVIPPAWFWVDYFLVFRRGGEQAQFEQFKHGQQVSAAIWAAIAVTLAALASSDVLGARGRESNTVADSTRVQPPVRRDSTP